MPPRPSAPPGVAAGARASRHARKPEATRRATTRTSTSQFVLSLCLGLVALLATSLWARLDIKRGIQHQLANARGRIDGRTRGHDQGHVAISRDPRHQPRVDEASEVAMRVVASRHSLACAVKPFTRLEIHAEQGHGDVCRDANGLWACPDGCNKVAGAPYCTLPRDEGVCRAAEHATGLLPLPAPISRNPLLPPPHLDSAGAGAAHLTLADIWAFREGARTERGPPCTNETARDWNYKQTFDASVATVHKEPQGIGRTLLFQYGKVGSSSLLQAFCQGYPRASHNPRQWKECKMIVAPRTKCSAYPGVVHSHSVEVARHMLACNRNNSAFWLVTVSRMFPEREPSLLSENRVRLVEQGFVDPGLDGVMADLDYLHRRAAVIRCDAYECGFFRRLARDIGVDKLPFDHAFHRGLLKLGASGATHNTLVLRQEDARHWQTVLSSIPAFLPHVRIPEVPVNIKSETNARKALHDALVYSPAELRAFVNCDTYELYTDQEVCSSLVSCHAARENAN